MDRQFNDKDIAKVKKILGLRDDQMIILLADHPTENGVRGYLNGPGDRMYTIVNKLIPVLRKQMLMSRLMETIGELFSTK